MSLPRIQSEAPTTKTEPTHGTSSAVLSPLSFQLQMIAGIWTFSAVVCGIAMLGLFFVAMSGQSPESGIPASASVPTLLWGVNALASALVSWTFRLLCLAAAKHV